MTRDEILKMEAGREMDALIAEKVMGLDHFAHKWEADGECEKCRCEIDFHSGRIYLNNKKVDNKNCSTPDSYSTDIAAAWEVLEKLAQDQVLIRLDVSESCGNLLWWCMMGKESDDGERVDGIADVRLVENSAPLAICRAALLAVME